jgi:hypothetical protein
MFILTITDMKLLTKIKPYLTIKLLVSTVVGLVGGYAYYYFIGCNSGSCAITSSPVNSMIWGTFMGVTFGWPTKKDFEKQAGKSDQEVSPN